MVSAPINPRTGTPILERIGLFGPPKVGKTHQLFNIAKWHQALGSDAIFYGISTDYSWDVLSMNPEFSHLTNLRWENCGTLREMIAAARKYNALIRPHDFLCSDLQSDAWGFAQDEYAAQRAGTEDLGDLWLEGQSDKYPIAGWDWGMPNGRFRAYTNNQLLRCPGHLVCVYAQKELMTESRSGNSDEDPKLKDMFKHLGVKPDGQKGDPFRWHTILHIDAGGAAKTQTIATAGERWGNREWLGMRMGNGRVRGVPLKDFFMDYLVGVAGWTM